MPRGVRRWSALSARSVSRYSALDVNMVKAALTLANVTGKPDYIERAKAWADVLDQHYWSENLGGYYFTADDTSDLIVRPFSGQDEATPNANGTMVSNLVALYLWTGEEPYRERADAILRGFAGAMAANVLAHGLGLRRGRPFRSFHQSLPIVVDIGNGPLAQQTRPPLGLAAPFQRLVNDDARQPGR